MPRYAAIDIGSNSARMMAAEVNYDRTTILAQDRQVTRLGESVFRDGRISAIALEFVVSTLSGFANEYQRLDVAGVRAVATSAVRDASNQAEFLKRASEALGTEVEIISGSEEARLIHLGVQAQWPRPDERTLIIDVGGGSAELIIGEGSQIIDAVSKPCGAVRLNELFLKHDPPEQDEITRLQSFINEKLDDFYSQHKKTSFDRAIATSASAAAVVCALNSVPRTKREEADRLAAPIADLRQWFQTLSASSLAQRRKMNGIGPRRAEIIIAGAAVFLQTLEMFGHNSFYYSVAGVRDGIIADLAARGVGRELSRLPADQRALMEEMAARYQVKRGHAAHVAYLAGQLFEILQPAHKLPASDGKLLEAAAFLHDIGHFVTGTGHHKHSAYLVLSSDLPGFTDREREVIAALCRFHRKSLPQPKHAYFDSLQPESRRLVGVLTPLLRLADSLDRSHEQRVQRLRGSSKDGNLSVLVESDQDVDFELWAANEASKAFREIYGRPLQVQRARRQSA